MASLTVWMNGERVGEWATLRTGTPVFRYEASWTQSRSARALSLSLPITANREVRGEAVEYYFDNLLPDSAEVRRRIRMRFQTRSTDAFDLLSAIGRDCVGAVQLLPADQTPEGWNRIDAEPLTASGVEQVLRAVTLNAPLGPEEQNEFRISLAGAQEKTALLRMALRVAATFGDQFHRGLTDKHFSMKSLAPRERGNISILVHSLLAIPRMQLFAKRSACVGIGTVVQ